MFQRFINEVLHGLPFAYAYVDDLLIASHSPEEHSHMFQRFINEVLHGLPFAYAYVDDLLIASHSPEEHLQHLRSVLERSDTHGILINVSKSVFGVPALDFLGYHLDANGIRPLDQKVLSHHRFSSSNIST